MHVTKHPNEVDTLLTGGTGLIGRWLLAELTRRGRVVAVPLRDPARSDTLRQFVANHGGDPDRMLCLKGDVREPAMGLTVALPRVCDVYHLAARFAFNLKVEIARETNVDGTLHVAQWAAKRPALRRFVYVGGYRVSSPPPWLGRAYPLTERARRRLYRECGGYEGSKHEAHLALRAFAEEQGMPFSAVNPSGVLGDSRTGETVQTEGMGDTVQRLWHGQLPALPGSPRTFVPQVTVDYLARFLATVPERDSTIGQDLCVLDPSTPNLPALIDSMARHMGVDPPKARVPVSVVRALPKALRGGVEREALRFLVEDRYDTTAADSHAAAAGLEPPDGAAAIGRWLDYLVSTRFLSQPSLSTGPAVRFANRHPRKVARVVLIAPYFLQARPPRLGAVWPLAAFAWSRATPATWATRLGVDAGLPALDSAIADLRRGKVARRTARALASLAGKKHRADLRAELARLTVPAMIVVGDRDPLVSPIDLPTHVIAGAGHNVHVSHPEQVAAVVRKTPTDVPNRPHEVLRANPA